MLLSIHVPKTAGTNFTETLRTLFDPERIHLDYGTERDLTTARTCAPWIREDPAGFAARFDIVHGHYHYLKYGPVFPEADVLITLRHPVARVVSQYRHIALHGDRNVERHRKIMDGEMDLLQFSRFHFIGNAQAVFLEGYDVERLRHAIIQEHFAATVERFCAAVGADPKDPKVQDFITRPINSREDTGWETKAVPIDPETFAQIEKNCDLDMQIYNRAVERFV